MSATVSLGLDYLVVGQGQKEVTHNEALNDLDALVHLCVAGRDVNAPPASPVEGARYLVGAAPSGDWVGCAGKLASYYGGWRFKTPKKGWVAFVESESRFFYYSGTQWELFLAPEKEASLSWNPGTLAQGAGATSSDVAVSNAALGDFVRVAPPYDLQGVLAFAYVRAAGVVVIRIQNQTGSSVTLGSGSWKLRVGK